MRNNAYSFILVTVILSTVLTSAYIMIPSAYGHGLGKDDTDPKNLGDRVAFLRTEIVPELKEFGELKDIVLTIQLIDAQTEENIPGMAYHLLIEKFANNKLLLEEAFHIMNDNDNLVINFQTTENGDIDIKGQKTGETLGYMAKDNGLFIEGPIFTHAGLYHLTVEVVAMEGETLDVDERQTYETLITLAESKTFHVKYDGKKYGLETISYFDNIVDFKFDPNRKSITMLMPFNWHEDFVENVSLLHAELFIPKEFTELAKQEFGGLINGIEDPIFVDRSPPDEVVIHYMTPKKRLMNISDRIMQEGTRNDVVEFGLVTKGIVKDDGNGEHISTPEPGSIQEWSPVIETTTSGGSIILQAQWSPISIETDKPVTFKLKFIDPETKEEIENATYTIMFYDPDGNHVDSSHRSKQTDEFQTYIFDRTGSFKLLLTNVNFSGERAEIQLSVIPEFPIGVLFITGAMIAGMLVLVRFKSPTIKNMK